ncbi:hypothetical protein ACSLOE_30300, partial [Escherichia coli]|uniref:hypothetical protein n=1 Tax=Escherichia coli TaxID=562 RepID=UPI003EE0E0BD
VSPPSGNAVVIFPFAGSETGFFPAHYGIPVPPIASGEYGKNRTRIFESVDLMRDRSGYICDRSEIGQRPPLQRVYSSATFEQL